MPISKLSKLAVLSLLTLSAAAGAQEAFPSRPITIVVPYATGGTADLLARISADFVSKELGQPVVVDSKPGAGGSLGMEHVVRSAPDGYTLVLTASGSMAINPYVYKLRYKPVDDLASVTVLADVPFIFVANPNTGIKDLDSFRKVAKAQPGGVSSGNAGSGTQAHLTQELFRKAAGVPLNIIPYKGSAPAINDLLGNQIDTMIDNIAAQTSFIKAGKVQPLFVTSLQRVPSLPNVPTAAEAGLAGFSAVAWFGLAVPKGTPPALLTRIQQSIAKGFTLPETRAKLESLGLSPVANSPAEADARVRKDYDTFGVLAKQLNLKPQ
jgi:tripartite-type tricarboxylate transporter receptor subunit TctC